MMPSMLQSREPGGRDDMTDESQRTKALPVHSGAFTVLRIFDCKPGESERFALQLGDFVTEHTRFHQGFLSWRVYLTDDACKVVEFFQWLRAEDWQAYGQSEDGRRATELHAGLIPNVQFLETVRAVGAPPPGGNGQPQGAGTG
jgi:hypothetical protein